MGSGNRNAVNEAIGAFQIANLVGLGERHWAREDSEFRLRLLRDAAFARNVNDIVVECATARYQDLLDSFVNGADVPGAELSAIWRDTTQPGAFDSPVYEEFLRAVREVNGGLPPGRRLRVVAGDPPIDWNGDSGEQIRECVEGRDRFAAAVIEGEVLRKGRKALVVYGGLHLCRRRAGSIVELLEGTGAARWFGILPVDGAERASPSEPLLIKLADDPLGESEANEVLGKGAKRVKWVDGKPVMAQAQLFEPGVRLREVADAALDFGDAPPELVPRPDGIAGTEYGREVDRRRAILMRCLPR